MLYLDTSALTKLILDEKESSSLREYIGETPSIVCSEIVKTELPRAVLRADPMSIGAVHYVLERLAFLSIDAALLTLAGTLLPPSLKSLDAIHLAAAATLRDELVAFVAYDVRLLAAAADMGLPVASPGQTPEVADRIDRDDAIHPTGSSLPR